MNIYMVDKLSNNNNIGEMITNKEKLSWINEIFCYNKLFKTECTGKNFL